MALNCPECGHRTRDHVGRMSEGGSPPLCIVCGCRHDPTFDMTAVDVSWG